MSRLLPAERGTRILFGKPYHWHLVAARLSLVGGGVDDCMTCEQVEDTDAKLATAFEWATQ